MNEEEKLVKVSVYEDNLFIIHDDLLLMTANEKINWMRQNGYLHIWFLPLNWLQDGTPYVNCPVVNIPKFMHLDDSLNRDILHSLIINRVLRCYILDGEETN